jgi:hypothetical protein
MQDARAIRINRSRCHAGRVGSSPRRVGSSTSTRAGVTHDRHRRPRDQVHVSCVTAAGVRVTGAPVHDNGYRGNA